MKTLIIYIIFLLLLFLTISVNAQSFYQNINAIRAEKKLPPLKRSIFLEIKSQIWLNHIHRHKMGMVHDFNTNNGEILTNAQNPIVWWMNSPSHKKILLSRKFRKIGLSKKNGVYCARFN